MLTALAFVALAGAVAMLLLFRREGGRSAELRDLVQLPTARLEVPTPPPRTARGGEAAVATLPERPAPEPLRSEPESAPDLERVRLEEWRRRQLLAAGLSEAAADEAAGAGIDAAAFRTLVARGCPPELALRILL
ncbi:MAG TPA: hypothetical protein VFJ77_09680 [Gaiellaceae bacterium]|nr:hypothetical protein [Gaiellaceae bacterium]